MFNEKVDDTQLLKLLLGGGRAAEQAFSLLVKKYSSQLYWQIRRITRNHEETNDILQNVWVKIWNNLSEFKQDSLLSTWMYRICRNETINFLQKEKRTRAVNLDEGVVEIISGHSGLDQFSPDEISACLLKAIDTLPDKQALVFQLKYFEDLKYSEIAEQVGTSEGALKASYHHAVQKIQDFLKMQLNL